MHGPGAGELGRLQEAFGPQCTLVCPGLRTAGRVGTASGMPTQVLFFSGLGPVWDAVEKPVAFMTQPFPPLLTSVLPVCGNVMLNLLCTQTLSHEELQRESMEVPPSASQHLGRAEVMSFSLRAISSTLLSLPSWFFRAFECGSWELKRMGFGLFLWCVLWGQ